MGVFAMFCGRNINPDPNKLTDKDWWNEQSFEDQETWCNKHNYNIAKISLTQIKHLRFTYG